MNPNGQRRFSHPAHISKITPNVRLRFAHPKLRAPIGEKASAKTAGEMVQELAAVVTGIENMLSGTGNLAFNFPRLRLESEVSAVFGICVILV